MDPLPLVVGILGLAGIVGFVAAPLVGRRDPEASPTSASLPALERRDRALAALRELEFDHRTDKVTDADYRELLGPLRHEAAEALQAVDAAGETR